jgi:L-alanine-DL-glutamate epimerase-like enolase superfamily enzyme
MAVTARIATVEAFVVVGDKDYVGGAGLATPGQAGPGERRRALAEIGDLHICVYPPQAQSCLVKLTADDGTVGWGEAHAPVGPRATAAVVTDVLAPLLVGQDPLAIEQHWERMYGSMRLRGHVAGYQLEAIAGVDIALWDLAGKRAGLPVCRMLGAGSRRSVTAYTSLMRLHEPATVATACERALERGFRRLKLHEITVPAVAAARQALGADVELMLDVNCAWPADEALRMAHRLEPYGLKWLEEPVWPPEDVAGLARLRREANIPLAAGENVGNAWAFQPLAESGALDYFQPSITKVGGITEFRAVAELARSHGRAVAPHSPYFGPGLLATLQMAAVYAHIGGIEIFGVQLESGLFGAVGLPGPDGEVAIPQGPGLGCDPDPEVIARYRIG